MSPRAESKKAAKKAPAKKATLAKVGDVLHGYQSGVFGKGSWSCRRVEAAGEDWIVTRIIRPTMGQATVEFAHGTRALLVTPNKRTDDCFCGDS